MHIVWLVVRYQVIAAVQQGPAVAVNAAVDCAAHDSTLAEAAVSRVQVRADPL